MINASIIKRVEAGQEDYKYSDVYLYYLVSKYLYDRCFARQDDIELMLYKYYANDIKRSHLQDFLFGRFTSVYRDYSINEKQKKNYIQTQVFLNSLNECQKTEDNLLLLKIAKNGVGSKYLAETMVYWSAYNMNHDSLPSDYYASQYYCLLDSFDKRQIKLDYALESIDDTYFDVPVDMIIKNQRMLTILYSNGINAIKDLTVVSQEFLLAIFSLDFDVIIAALTAMQENYLADLKKEIDERIGLLSDVQKEIIERRNGFYGKKKETLEEIGNTCKKTSSVTRERIRQIEKKALECICSNGEVINIKLALLYYRLCKKNSLYVSEAELKDSDLSAQQCEYIKLFLSCSTGTIRYDYDYGILYDKSVSKIEDLIANAISSCGSIVTLSSYTELSEFEKRVVDNHYRLYKETAYIRKGTKGSYLILALMDELFPSGYHIGNGDDYLLLKNEYLKRYGSDSSSKFQTERAVTALLGQGEYCLIDKGTYKREIYCSQISDELRNEILEYISQNKQMVYYQMVYEHFKGRLIEEGIENRYLLKGQIDKFIEPPMTTKRDYIMTGEEKITSREVMVNYFRSFSSKFSFEDVQNRFPGIKDYIISFAISAQEKNGLLTLPNKEYIYLDNLNISQETLTELDNYINSLAKQLDSRVISSSKLMGRMKLFNKELLQKLNGIDDQFSLFSLIKHVFAGKYDMRRPLISLDVNNNLTSLEVVRDYVRTLDSFNVKAVNNYINKMSLRVLYSYLMFMEGMSGEFVQISIDGMVTKAALNASQEQINQLKTALELIINSNNVIDTRVFMGYRIFPKFNHPWNKYLLAGIVRSYLSESFEIENTTNTYDDTDFIIRRFEINGR